MSTEINSDSAPYQGEFQSEPEEETLGRFFRRIRLGQGKSLEEVAARTKIHVSSLSAIEEDNPRALPAEVFTRGFIRSYAQFLGLDPEEALNWHSQQNKHLPQSAEKINVQEMLAGEAMAESVTIPLGRIFLITLLVGGLLYAAYWLASSFQQEVPQPAVVSVPPQQLRESSTPPIEPTGVPSDEVVQPADESHALVDDPPTEESFNKPVISPDAGKSKPGQASTKKEQASNLPKPGVR